MARKLALGWITAYGRDMGLVNITPNLWYGGEGDVLCIVTGQLPITQFTVQDQVTIHRRVNALYKIIRIDDSPLIDYYGESNKNNALDVPIALGYTPGMDIHDPIIAQWKFINDIYKQVVKILDDYEPVDALTKRGQNLEYEGDPIKKQRKMRQLTPEERQLAEFFGEKDRDNYVLEPESFGEIVKKNGLIEPTWDNEEDQVSFTIPETRIQRTVTLAGISLRPDEEFAGDFFDRVVAYVAKMLKLPVKFVTDKWLVSWAQETKDPQNRNNDVILFPVAEYIRDGYKWFSSLSDIGEFLKQRRESVFLDVDDGRAPEEEEDDEAARWLKKLDENPERSGLKRAKFGFDGLDYLVVNPKTKKEVMCRPRFEAAASMNQYCYTTPNNSVWFIERPRNPHSGRKADVRIYGSNGDLTLRVVIFFDVTDIFTYKSFSEYASPTRETEKEIQTDQTILWHKVTNRELVELIENEYLD